MIVLLIWLVTLCSLIGTSIEEPRVKIRLIIPEIYEHHHHVNTVYKHVHHHLPSKHTKTTKPKVTTSKHYHLHQHVYKPPETPNHVPTYEIDRNYNNVGNIKPGTNLFHKYEVHEIVNTITPSPPKVYGFVNPDAMNRPTTEPEHKPEHGHKPEQGHKPDQGHHQHHDNHKKYEYRTYEQQEGYKKELPLIEEGSYGETIKKGNENSVKTTNQESIFQTIEHDNMDEGGQKEGGYYENTYHSRKTPERYHGSSVSGKHEQDENKRQGDHEHNKGFKENTRHATEDQEDEKHAHQDHHGEDHAQEDEMDRKHASEDQEQAKQESEHEDNEAVYAVYYPYVVQHG